MSRISHPAVRVLSASTLAAVGLGIVAATGPSGSAAATTTISIVAPNGHAGGQVGFHKGSDQAEDQGENIAQWAQGGQDLGPISVGAKNTVHADGAKGGDGGDVMITYDNKIYASCVDGAAGPFRVAVQRVHAFAGAGGRGGASAGNHKDSLNGQGSDQGEDQGENIAQFVENTRPRTVEVNAVNRAHSGNVVGGHGGNVKVVFNNTTVCGAAPAGSSTPPPPSKFVDGSGNIAAAFYGYADCGTNTLLDGTVLNVRAGNGGAGGSVAEGQGSDQGEDQGENIGQWATGSVTTGGIHVFAPHNFLSSGMANGHVGASVSVTFHNIINCTTSSTAAPLSDTAPVQVHAGAGGVGGTTGRGQSADQGEDQGENIGQFAVGRTRFGNTSVIADSKAVAGDAQGGPGGHVTVVYHDASSCSTTGVVAMDERVAAAGGYGGRGGSSGRDQGSDQGEDQGENIGQFATGRVHFGDINVRSTSTLQSGDSSGGHGGSVTAAYHPAGCPSDTVGTSSLLEAVHVIGGHGGHGGSSAHGQGSDQGEDQGENIGQFASGQVRFHDITVDATNVLLAGDANGGAGGSIHVTRAVASCQVSTCTSLTSSQHVTGAAGRGGTGGSSGRGQGSDQSEDQGENILQRARGGVIAGRVKVTPHNTIHSGLAVGGKGGDVVIQPAPRAISARSTSCVPLIDGLMVAVDPGLGGGAGADGRVTSGPDGLTRAAGCAVPRLAWRSAIHLARHLASQAFSRVKICRGKFGGTAVDLIVPSGAVCTVTANAQIVHDLTVRPGGALRFLGAEVGHNLLAKGAAGVLIRGGTVGHTLSVIRLLGHRFDAGNEICGAQVESDILVAKGLVGARRMVIGNNVGCPGNRADHDIKVESNAFHVVIRNNTAAHAVFCARNAAVDASGNTGASSVWCASKG
jgi:hypothetical protein